MRLVERMTLDPCRCLVCGRGNVPDGDTGDIGPFIDLDMESGWQDHSYLCTDCGVKVGAMAGMVTPDEAKDLEREVRRLKIELHEKDAQLDETSRRLQKTQKRLLKV
jgi:hypothetical protein